MSVRIKSIVDGSRHAAIHAIAVEFLSFVAIVSAFLDVDGSPTAAYDNLAPAVLCFVFMLIVLRY